MTRSQPISLTSAATNPEATAPVPFLLVIPGYDAAETQTLKNVEGVLTWVTDAPSPAPANTGPLGSNLGLRGGWSTFRGSS